MPPLEIPEHKRMISIFIFLVALILFFESSIVFGQESKNRRLPNFPRKYELKDTTSSIDISNLNMTISHHEELIAKYPDEPFIPNLMFEVAELSANKSRFEFNQEMHQYELEIEKFEKGETFREPILPRVSYKKTIETCYKLLEKFPSTQFKDKVLYRLAISHIDEGNQEKAKYYLQKLIFETPDSPKVSEGHFRLGEYYFNKRDFDKAIKQYERLLEKWDDPYFNYALYKLGWAYFNVNDFSNSISIFTYLISDITLLETMNTELLGKTKADVRNEAIDYIAHSFTEYEGSLNAKELLSREDTLSFSIDVLKKMGEIYKKRNFYKDAINTYQLLLELYPFYTEAPLIQKEIIQCFENDMDEIHAAKAKDDFVQTYGPNSEWLNQHPEGEVRDNAVTMSEDMLYSLGTHYQAKAQGKNSETEYKLAIEKHEDFLHKFRNSDKAFRVNYYLAECYFEINEFDKAADEYYKVMTYYGDNEFFEDAAYNIILSYYQLSNETTTSDSVTYYIEDFIGGGDAIIPVKVNSEAQFKLIRACNDFVRQIPESKNLLEVLMKYGETLYELQKWDLAANVYELTISPEYRNLPFYAQSINMIAHCYLKLGKYAESEKWFNNLSDAFPDSSHYVERAKKMVATAKFKVAENLKNEGRTNKAALNFLKLAFSTKDNEIAKAAIFQASNQFEEAGETDKAIKAYERMLEEQPNIMFKDELLIKTGLLYENKEKWFQASNNYMKLVNQCPKSKFAPQALLSAASCYEQMSLSFKCKQAYRLYTNRFANVDPDDYIETLYKIAEISYNGKDKNSALSEYRLTVQKFKELRKNRISVAEYLPAKAQFMIAEITFEKYEQVKIVPPLNVSMKRKTKLLNEVVEKYLETSNYHVADWTTASFYKMGMAFEHLCAAIYDAPIPAELAEEEKQAYSETISKIINPFKQKALDCYKANIANAQKNNLENEWVVLSQKRLERLVLDLGLESQSELTQKQNKPMIVQTKHTKGSTP
jgi:cellulose synthase operon protein C